MEQVLDLEVNIRACLVKANRVLGLVYDLSGTFFYRLLYHGVGNKVKKHNKDR